MARTTSYVIDKDKGYVSHQGNEKSCNDYVRTCGELWGKFNFSIAHGAKDRDRQLRQLKR